VYIEAPRRKRRGMHSLFQFIEALIAKHYN
jgi:hypothetical protein